MAYHGNLENPSIVRCPYCRNWCLDGDFYRPFDYCQHDIYPAPVPPSLLERIIATVTKKAA